MKKLLFTIIFTLLSSVCFAEDVYTVMENGTAKYLRSQSLTANVQQKNDQDSLFEMTYTLICIPDKVTLEKLRGQTLDNKISYKKQTFTFKCSFNKITNQWNTDGSLWLNDDELWGGSPEKCLYESHGCMPAGTYYGDDTEATFNRSIVITAYNYAASHKLIKFY
ncbi:MAG: hypothetical protein LLG02_14035 [Pelosinus sp.]|nr:hypothetical protein [Pelosinus sp.]